MEFEFDYSKLTFEEIDTYYYFEFVCDGDEKIIKAKIRER